MACARSGIIEDIKTAAIDVEFLHSAPLFCILLIFDRLSKKWLLYFN